MHSTTYNNSTFSSIVLKDVEGTKLIKSLLFKVLFFIFCEIIDDAENLTSHTVVVIEEADSCVIEQRGKLRCKERRHLEMLGHNHELSYHNLSLVIGYSVLDVKVLKAGGDLLPDGL